MAIETIMLPNGIQAREVTINAGEALQCCTAQDSAEAAANLLMFFEPAAALEENELANRQIGDLTMLSEPVMIRFNTSAAILPLVQDLMIIYGNLTKQGL